MKKVLEGSMGLIRDMDFFAVPVSLTYKGKMKFGTLLGGCVSLLFIMAFATYSALNLHELITRPVLQGNSEKLYYSLSNNKDEFSIMSKNSTLAVAITSSDTP